MAFITLNVPLNIPVYLTPDGEIRTGQPQVAFTEADQLADTAEGFMAFIAEAICMGAVETPNTFKYEVEKLGAAVARYRDSRPSAR